MGLLENIIDLLFSGEQLSVPQIQIQLAVKFGIHVKRQQIIQVINNNENQFYVVRGGKQRKVGYHPRQINP